MNRPRVIIADTDDKYIIPLQLKFIKEYFDKIDLETITDETYFDNLFEKPQKVDILIVSDTLYHSLLQKHDIAHIFVMTEQNEEGSTEELNINRLYKYTSIKEIFSEIVGNSQNVLDVDNKEKKETQIVVVTSSGGGVGKTTVAMGICASLAKNYKRVLYINASRLQIFQHMLENKETISEREIYTQLRSINDHIYSNIKHIIRKEGFSYIPAFKASLLSLGLEYSIYSNLIQSAKGSNEYDYIIVDTESTFDEYKTELLDIADKIVIVTEQSRSSVYATNLFVANITENNINKYIFVCNKFKKEGYNALISTENAVKFTVNEYISEFEGNGIVKCDDLAKLQEIRKVAFLMV